MADLWWDDASYAEYQGDPLASEGGPSYEPTPFHVIDDRDGAIVGRYRTADEAATAIEGTEFRIETTA